MTFFHTMRTTALAGVVAALATPAAAQTIGVTDDEIKIGSTMPFSGPASAYAQYGETMSAYFDKVNAEEGGVNGRKINFIMYDDGYSPPKTKEQVRKLIEQDEVAFLYATLGTPTNSAIHKYVNQKEVPHLFVTTGATKWGQPDKYPWTMGWAPNYQSEGVVFARYLLESKPDSRIGILFQNDDYGKDYVHGLENGLGDEADEMIVARESFEVADPTVDSQVIALAATDANVFYNVTTPKFAAQAIRKAYDIGWENEHLLNSVSNTVGAVLKPAGLEKSKGIVTTLFLMDAMDPEAQKTDDFKAWDQFMTEYHPDGDRTSNITVYGYASAQTLVQVLKQAGDDLSRENIMKQAANLKDFEPGMLMDGIKVNTSSTDFFPIEQLQLARFNGERYVLFGEIIEGTIRDSDS